MNKQDFIDAYISLLSGAAKIKNSKEIYWQTKYGNEFTIEFVDFVRRCIVRNYYKNGQVNWEDNYKNGNLDGSNKGWYESGQLHWKYNYKNGNLDGLSKGWHENGQVNWKHNYKNGKLI